MIFGDGSFAGTQEYEYSGRTPHDTDLSLVRRLASRSNSLAGYGLETMPRVDRTAPCVVRDPGDRPDDRGSGPPTDWSILSLVHSKRGPDGLLLFDMNTDRSHVI
jgi:hypothetical protein